MEIIYLEPFISYDMLVFLELLLVFGGLIWFARGQIRACRRPASEEDKPSALATQPRRPLPPRAAKAISREVKTPTDQEISVKQRSTA
ncbi:MAG: hypothetical protein AAGI34_09095 [Pseudomonadota bacterium]